MIISYLLTIVINLLYLTNLSLIATQSSTTQKGVKYMLS